MERDMTPSFSGKRKKRGRPRRVEEEHNVQDDGFQHHSASPELHSHHMKLCSKDDDEPTIYVDLNYEFHVFNEYKVRKEIVPLLTSIFTKYGDIAKKSTFSTGSRSCLLELVCNIYNQLKSLKFSQLTPLELESMLEQIGDLELVKVEVGWLRKRLRNIAKVRDLCDGVSSLKDVETKKKNEIGVKKKTIETYEGELVVLMGEVRKMEERLKDEEDELLVEMDLLDEINVFSQGSLAKGLL